MISPVKIWRRQKKTRMLLGETGIIISWTKIFVPGNGFQRYAPYPVVLVKFNDGEKAVGQLADYDDNDLRIGQSVKTVLRKVREGTDDGVIAYGIKFKLT